MQTSWDPHFHASVHTPKQIKQIANNPGLLFSCLRTYAKTIINKCKQPGLPIFIPPYIRQKKITHANTLGLLFSCLRTYAKTNKSNCKQLGTLIVMLPRTYGEENKTCANTVGLLCSCLRTYDKTNKTCANKMGIYFLTSVHNPDTH